MRGVQQTPGLVAARAAGSAGLMVEIADHTRAGEACRELADSIRRATVSILVARGTRSTAGIAA